MGKQKKPPKNAHFRKKEQSRRETKAPASKQLSFISETAFQAKNNEKPNN